MDAVEWREKQYDVTAPPRLKKHEEQDPRKIEDHLHVGPNMMMAQHVESDAGDRPVQEDRRQQSVPLPIDRDEDWPIP